MQSNLKSKPSWLSYYPNAQKTTEGVHFGFENDGMFFSGDSNGVSYPIRTNFDYPSNQPIKIVYTILHNDGCSDHGVCVYKADFEPEWDWGFNETRISLNINCGIPELDGQGQGGEGGMYFTVGNYYTIEFSYIPLSNLVSVNIYDGASTDSPLMGTLTLNERLPEGPYRLGFDADQDNEGIKSYFTYLNVPAPTGHPMPMYTFRVNIIDYTSIYSNTLPDSIDGIIRNLESASVYVPYVEQPLKHGDEFTLYGSQAIRVYEMYIGKEPKVLELA